MGHQQRQTEREKERARVKEKETEKDSYIFFIRFDLIFLIPKKLSM